MLNDCRSVDAGVPAQPGELQRLDESVSLPISRRGVGCRLAAPLGKCVPPLPPG